jgi:hypothetical protein
MASSSFSFMRFGELYLGVLSKFCECSAVSHTEKVRGATHHAGRSRRQALLVVARFGNGKARVELLEAEERRSRTGGDEAKECLALLLVEGRDDIPELCVCHLKGLGVQAVPRT